MNNLVITIFAYLIDRKFGEFTFIKHPVIMIGGLINFFEKHWYKDEVGRGAFLVLFVLIIVGTLSIMMQIFLLLLNPILYILSTSIIASIFIAHKMLRDSVLGVLSADDKRAAISMLVSRDTQEMSESDIYKACIETYGENLSDGVVAPLLYLLLFGVPGIVLYKAINTMDSMVGYRNKRYEKYGKVAAILDDIANFIPSRITAVLIMLVSKQRPLFKFYKDGEKHDSPNAGHPITAMALALGLKLGGDTSYFGKIKHKANFGNGRDNITQLDVINGLNLGKI